MDSKYTAALLGAGIALWLVGTPEGRRWLRTPWPWAGGALAGLCFAPVLWWNAAHGWASFAKQGGRTGDWRPADALRHVAELLGGQLGLGTPAVADPVRGRRRGGDAPRGGRVPRRRCWPR